MAEQKGMGKQKAGKSVTKALKATVTGVSDEVTLVDGRVVKIRVCSGLVLPELLDFLGDVADDLNLNLADIEGTTEVLLSKVKDIGYLLKLISKYSDKIYSLVAGMSDIEKGEIYDLEVDDILKLVMSVAAVNKDFFMKRVLPLFQASRTLAR